MVFGKVAYHIMKWGDTLEVINQWIMLMTRTRKIDKQHVAEVILYAINQVPNTDERTLQTLLELVKATGRSDWITDQQLLERMKSMVKYAPGTCGDSLLTVIELLDICVPLNVRSANMSLIAPKIEQD